MMKSKILIVDDNELNRKLAGFSLSKIGYHVLLAEDGAGAVAMAIENKPSLILMDIGMEGWDGIKTMKLIRKEEGLKEIPILAFTAFAMKGDREKLISDGFDGYISKPVKLEKMIETIKKLCPL